MFYHFYCKEKNVCLLNIHIYILNRGTKEWLSVGEGGLPKQIVKLMSSCFHLEIKKENIGANLTPIYEKSIKRLNSCNFLVFIG